ncbi:MAG: patatin-like phospholipase family protein [Burkholderiaceae bacterium]
MFEQVVFAGGGNRCWWQAGFWDKVAPEIGLQPRLIGGVSAGAATACMLYANTSEAVLAYYEEKLAQNRRNAHWNNLFRRGERVFPHARIYRQALKDVLGGARFIQLLETAPEIRIQFSRLPRRLGPRAAVGVGLLAYNVEKYWKKSLHPQFGRRLGFTSEVVRVQDCPTDEDLVSLLIASSCTPPFTPIEYRNGRPTLDGGLVDNVPVDAVERGRSTLVLVTRRYKRRPTVFVHAGKLYVQPSQKVPVSSWDYTDPSRMRLTYQQGRTDGASFLADWARHLGWMGEAAQARTTGDSKGLEA